VFHAGIDVLKTLAPTPTPLFNKYFRLTTFQQAPQGEPVPFSPKILKKGNSRLYEGGQTGGGGARRFLLFDSQQGRLF